MAAKAVENAVRELTTTISALVIKVSALETKIEAQNSLITKLTSPQSSTAAITTTPKGAQQAAAQTALQRPVRQVRLKAAITASGKLNAAKLTGAKPTARASLYNASATTPPTPEPSQPPPAEDVATKISTTNDQPMTQIQPLASTNTPTDQYSSDTFTNSTEDQWETVKSKRARRRSQRAVTVGTGKEDDLLQTVESLKYIQAWSFTPQTTTDNVTKFLNKIRSSEDFYVEKREIMSKRHASFIIGIPESLYPAFSSPAVWPPRVRFSDWMRFRPRPRETPRGNDDNGELHSRGPTS